MGDVSVSDSGNLNLLTDCVLVSGDFLTNHHGSCGALGLGVALLADHHSLGDDLADRHDVVKWERRRTAPPRRTGRPRRQPGAAKAAVARKARRRTVWTMVTVTPSSARSSTAECVPM